MSVLAKYFICLLVLHFQTTALCHIYTRWHTMECKCRSALLCVPDSTWHTMECNLTQPCSWFQWWYSRIQTSFSSTLCFQTPYGVQQNVNLSQPYSHMAYNGMWTSLSSTLCSRHHMAYNGMWTYLALLCVPDSIWHTVECKLTQPCSVAEPSATCTHPRRAEGKHSILHPAQKWPNIFFLLVWQGN